MSKSDDRIVLWRNGIQLFNKYTNFTGPFKSAGFDKYIVEQPFLTNDGEDVSPDIISSGSDGWVIFDLTTSPNSKEHNFEKYRRADPRSEGRQDLPFRGMPKPRGPWVQMLYISLRP